MEDKTKDMETATPSFKFMGRVQDLKLLKEMLEEYPNPRVKGSFAENVGDLKRRVSEKLKRYEDQSRCRTLMTTSNSFSQESRL